MIPKEEEVEKPQLSPEEVDAVIRPKFSESVKYLLEALGRYGDQDEEVQLQVTSPSTATYINPWTKAPLPYVIGTREFLEDDSIGLYVAPEVPEGIPRI